MAILLISVDWKSISTTESIPFNNIESINIRKDSEASASTANINLKNPMSKLLVGFNHPINRYVSDGNQILFNEGDTVKIYAAQVETVRDLDKSASSTDLLFSGEISEINVKCSEKSSKITLKCVDKTWVMLNKLWTFAYVASGNWTAPLIIQDVIRKVTEETSAEDVSFDSSGNIINGYQGGFLIDARLTSEGGHIESTRQNDTAFPNITIAKIFKPAYEFINDLSTLAYTNDFTVEDEDAPPQDRKMIFYVDEFNKFHWFYPTDTVSDDLNFIDGDNTTGNNIIGFNLTKKTFDIINMVIYNAGKDLFGSGILDYYYDKNSKDKQLKMVYKPYTEVAKDLIFQEIAEANLIKDNAQTVFTHEGNFYKSKGYNFSTTWGTTVTSDATYNTALRNQAIIAGDSKAGMLTRRRGNPRWKGSIECTFKKYTAGDLIKFTSTRVGLNEQLLRIKTAQYNITKSGGFVTLSVEEDEPKMGET